MENIINMEIMLKTQIKHQDIQFDKLKHLVFSIIFFTLGFSYCDKVSAFTLSVTSMVDQPNDGVSFTEFPTVTGSGRGGFTLTKEVGDSGTVDITLALLLTHAGTFKREDRVFTIDLDALAAGGSFSSGLFSIMNSAGPLSRGNYFTLLSAIAIPPDPSPSVPMSDRHDWKVVAVPIPEPTATITHILHLR